MFKKKMINNFKGLEETLSLMQKYQIDFIEVEGIKITKSYHDIGAKGEDDTPYDISLKKQGLTEEDILFHSADPKV